MHSYTQSYIMGVLEYTSSDSYGGREGHCPWYTLILMREPLSQHSSCPDVHFPTRELALTCISRRVNLSRRLFTQHVKSSPDVRFPTHVNMYSLLYV